MGLIMAKLIVRKEMLESEVHYDQNNSSHKVVLKDASQEQLAILKEKGIDVFEKPEKEK